MRAIVHTHVPLQILVDTETGTVEKAVIDDEAGIAPLQRNVTDENGADVTPAEASAACRVATDTEVMWPAWQFGW